MDRIQVLAKTLNFTVKTDNSSRTFGPRRELNNYKPEKGSEVFVGRLPYNAYEDEIYYFFSAIGAIYKIKLILKLNGQTKGFAFVTFMDRETAEKAVLCLKGKPLRPNNPLFVEISSDHCTLMLVSVDGEKASHQQIKDVFSSSMQTPVEVRVHGQDRSTYLIDFPEHQLAYRALREFPGSRVQSLWGSSANLCWEFNRALSIRKQEKENRNLLRQLMEQGKRQQGLLQLKKPQVEQELLLQNNLLQEQLWLGKFLQQDQELLSLSPDSGISSNYGSDRQSSPCQELLDFSRPTSVASCKAASSPLTAGGPPVGVVVSAIAFGASTENNRESTSCIRPPPGFPPLPDKKKNIGTQTCRVLHATTAIVLEGKNIEAHIRRNQTKDPVKPAHKFVFDSSWTTPGVKKGDATLNDKTISKRLPQLTEERIECLLMQYKPRQLTIDVSPQARSETAGSHIARFNILAKSFFIQRSSPVHRNRPWPTVNKVSHAHTHQAFGNVVDDATSAAQAPHADIFGSEVEVLYRHIMRKEEH